MKWHDTAMPSARTLKQYASDWQPIHVLVTYSCMRVPATAGSCFGKDIRALRESAREHEIGLSIIPAIEESNSRHKLHVPRRIERYFGSVDGKTIAVWGVAFKARTDDIRESPALDAIEALLQAGAKDSVRPGSTPAVLDHFGYQ